uniref:Uncharacterized protein n=1 Tax=Magallana gigas TaxID=29159 RepID=A0A8W8LEL1_MAGGI
MNLQGVWYGEDLKWDASIQVLQCLYGCGPRPIDQFRLITRCMRWIYTPQCSRNNALNKNIHRVWRGEDLRWNTTVQGLRCFWYKLL